MKKIFFVFVFVTSQFTFSQVKLSETDKLASTCKVWGFLKYYHPEVASGKFDWDEELYAVLLKVDEAKTKEDFSLVIENWISRLGDVPKVEIINKLPEELYFYKNLDLAWTQDKAFFSKAVADKLKWIEQNRHQGKQYYAYLSNGRLGHADDEVKEGKSGWIGLSNNRKSDDFTWSEKKYRLLTLFRYWNVIEYFAPNKYLTETNWTTCLHDILPKITKPKDERSYLNALLELVTKLNDSHASYHIESHNRHLKRLPTLFYLPVVLTIIDNKFVVAKIAEATLASKNDLQVGDVITLLDNKSVNDFLVENRNIISASNEDRFLNEVVKWHVGGKSEQIKIEYERGNVKGSKKIELYTIREHFESLEKSKDREKFKILEGNVGYLNIGNILKKEEEFVYSQVEKTKALIVDIRNYPNGNYLERFLLSKEKEFARQTYPDLTYPGRYIWDNDLALCGEDNPNYYKGKVVVLANAETLSWAETLVMIAQLADDVTVIGSQTAGADGVNNHIDVVSTHFYTTFTGKGFFYPDGREVQRKGVAIDIEVKPTIEGISQGKDEVLEKAIEYLNKTLN
ncbi:S41 family peptidase [Flavobacterium ardleyense]|uniref:S41 family peptidase n=1 Tax=Flavobacterium ardleyense TaxID=2038737 RepID=A0ABW5Z614_9FLAO